MQSVEQISQDLVNKWGPDVRRVAHDLNLLIGRALVQKDIMAFGFICEAVAAIMLEAVEIAKSIQAEQRHGGTVH